MARRKRGTLFNKQAPLSIGQRTKRILIWAGIMLGVVLLLLIAGYTYLLSWLQGDGFREYMITQIKNRTSAAEVHIPENVTVDGNHLTLPSCTVKDAKRIKEFNIHRLHLEVDRMALLRRILHLNHFSVEEMQFAFQLPTKDNKDSSRTSNTTKANTAPTTAQASVSASSSGVFIKDLRARSFESHYTDTSIVHGDNKFSLDGYHLIALPRPQISPNAWAIGIENGRIRTPFSWLKESGVKSATLLYRGDDIQLSEARIELAPGHLGAKGVYMMNSGLWKASIEVNQANVARLLNEDWRKRLMGELWGQLEMSGEASKSVWEARGELRLEKGVLEGLPFLSDLKLNDTLPYRSVQLEKASCQISYPYSEPEHGLLNAWLWDQIDVRAQGGILLLKGRVITGANGSLAGTLSIGIPAKVMADLGLSKTPIVTKLFNAPVELPGYVWLRVNLSGTVAEPQEDLSVRMAAILPETLPVLADKATKSLKSVIGSFIPGKQDANDTQATDEESPAPEADQADEPPVEQPRPGNKVRDIINSGLDMFF